MDSVTIRCINILMHTINENNGNITCHIQLTHGREDHLALFWVVDVDQDPLNKKIIKFKYHLLVLSTQEYTSIQNTVRGPSQPKA